MTDNTYNVNLPKEVISIILGYLHPYTLSNAVCSCRNFHHLVNHFGTQLLSSSFRVDFSSLRYDIISRSIQNRDKHDVSYAANLYLAVWVANSTKVSTWSDISKNLENYTLLGLQLNPRLPVPLSIRILAQMWTSEPSLLQIQIGKALLTSIRHLESPNSVLKFARGLERILSKHAAICEDPQCVHIQRDWCLDLQITLDKVLDTDPNVYETTKAKEVELNVPDSKQISIPLPPMWPSGRIQESVTQVKKSPWETAVDHWHSSSKTRKMMLLIRQNGVGSVFETI